VASTWIHNYLGDIWVKLGESMLETDPHRDYNSKWFSIWNMCRRCHIDKYNMTD
jgi:hypothetical protein